MTYGGNGANAAKLGRGPRPRSQALLGNALAHKALLYIRLGTPLSTKPRFASLLQHINLQHLTQDDTPDLHGMRPYRELPLSRLLSGHLGGPGITAISVTVAEKDFREIVAGGLMAGQRAYTKLHSNGKI